MNRKLKVTTPGQWYLVLTVGLGVVAMVSGNNILYVIESLLLSGLILSGVLSERVVSAVEVAIKRAPAIAGQKSRDLILLKNTRKFSLYCIEIGEIRDGKFVSIGFAPRLGPKESIQIPSRQVFGERGADSWQGLAVATAYPFGFALKIKVIATPGSRLIWPSRQELAANKKEAESQRKQSQHFGPEIADGEVRPANADDDYRLVIWKLSLKGMGDFVRVRRSDSGAPEVFLDCRVNPGEHFEREVRAAAQPFYSQTRDVAAGTLTVWTHQGKKRFTGRNLSLNALALAKANPSEKASA